MTRWNISVLMCRLSVSARLLNGLAAADGGCRWQTLQPAAFPHHDAPAFRRVFRSSNRYRNPCPRNPDIAGKTERDLRQAYRAVAEEIEKIMERDTFMAPDEAKKVGLIDEVVEKRPKPAGEE